MLNYGFEKEIHSTFRENGYLSKEQMGEIFAKYMKGYMGDFVEMPKGVENGWVHWPHIREMFYVYSYSCLIWHIKEMFYETIQKRSLKSNGISIADRDLSKSCKCC